MHKTFAEHWLTQGLLPEQQSAIYRIGEVLEVESDQVILEADTPNAYIYLLLEGAFRVRLPDRPGRSGARTLGHRGPGDLLGEYSFIDCFSPTARVIASTSGRVLRIDHEKLHDLLATDSAMSAVFYRGVLCYLVGRLRSQDEELACLLF